MYPHQIINRTAKGDSDPVGVGFAFNKTGGAQFGKHLAFDAALFIEAFFLAGYKGGGRVIKRYMFFIRYIASSGFFFELLHSLAWI